MRKGNFVGIDDREAFDFFRKVYNAQIKFGIECESAFHHSVRYFFKKYGYKPYENLEDYLSELFRKLNGFQLFNKY